MQFEYRGFTIECAAVLDDGRYVGSASVWRVLAADGKPRDVCTLKSFPTPLQAIDYARVLGEMWCDTQLDTARPVSALRRR